VFLPTIHESVRYLARHREPPASYTVGQAVEPADLGGDSVEMVLEAPDQSRTAIPAGPRTPLALERAGLYLLRPMAGGAGLPFAANLDPAESDLAQLDRSAFVAAAAGAEPGDGGAGGGPDLTAEERERRQRLWWYAALAALAILMTESVIAGVRPRGMGT